MSEATRRTRIHGPRRVLKELRRLRIKVERAEGRTLTPVDVQWLRSVADALDRLIEAGDAVLPGFADPREDRRVHKRERELF